MENLTHTKADLVEHTIREVFQGGHVAANASCPFKKFPHHQAGEGEKITKRHGFHRGQHYHMQRHHDRCSSYAVKRKVAEKLANF